MWRMQNVRHEQKMGLHHEHCPVHQRVCESPNTKSKRFLPVAARYIVWVSYETAEIARAVLNDLHIHVATGCTYQMPNDQRALVLARGMSDERPEKFAGNGKKPVRRGGS